MAPLNSEWFKHLPPEEQDKFKEMVRSSHRVLARLDELLSERLDHVAATEVTEKSYENPNWSIYQAHLNGRRAEILQIKKLFSFLE